MTHREGKLLGKKLGEPLKCPASPYPQQWFHSPREPLCAPSHNGLVLTLPPATFCLCLTIFQASFLTCGMQVRIVQLTTPPTRPPLGVTMRLTGGEVREGRLSLQGSAWHDQVCGQ